ncbi:TetR/AcrR family transcriptional regulator [Novosphingobium sp.]|uniref:TetR/AcrR family transcriptional regulator n=1 Tax=Novosphingobium sp. TaxID=1874826 RepID=UPI003FA6096D
MPDATISPAVTSETPAPANPAHPDPVPLGPVPGTKVPKTERGRKTLRALLNAAAEEFGEKGFHDAAISQITARAGVATGSFYVYFDSKEAIFQALVRDLSGQVKDYVAPRIAAAPDQLAAERAGQLAYLEFVRQHKEIYRIIDESEFVDPVAYREHYTNSANRIAARLEAATLRGEIAAGDNEVRAWAIMGMNVFLGLRYGVWGDEPPEAVVAEAGRLIGQGMAPTRPGGDAA